MFRRLRLLLPMALAAGLSFGEPTAARAAEPAGAEISILTYNVRGMPWPAAARRGGAMAAIGRELRELRSQGRQPDVVLIQEGFIGAVGNLAKASGYRYWAAGPGRRDRPAGGSRVRAKYLAAGEGWGRFVGSGLHVLSDLPIERVSRLVYSACAGFDCLANKGAMMVHLSMPGSPSGIDVVNTHLNSRKAAKVPVGHSLEAHRRQVDELMAFIAARRDARSPLLVGGDFNVKSAPDRYDRLRAVRSFKVVSEVCGGVGGCAGPPEGAPWLGSQDLQGFMEAGGVDLRPLGTAALFASADTGGRLSDHAGYLVRYRLAWTAPAPQLAAAPASLLRVAAGLPQPGGLP